MVNAENDSIILLSVVEEVPTTSFWPYAEPDMPQKLTQAKIKYLKEQIADAETKLKAKGVHYEVKLVVANDDIRVAVLREAEKIQPDMFVVATKSQSTLVQLIMGSVTQYAIHHATIPVLVIPPNRS